MNEWTQWRLRCIKSVWIHLLNCCFRYLKRNIYMYEIYLESSQDLHLVWQVLIMFLGWFITSVDQYVGRFFTHSNLSHIHVCVVCLWSVHVFISQKVYFVILIYVQESYLLQSIIFPGIIIDNIYTRIKPWDKNFIPYHSKQDYYVTKLLLQKLNTIHWGLTVFMNNSSINISKTIYRFAKPGICIRYLDLKGTLTGVVEIWLM